MNALFCVIKKNGESQFEFAAMLHDGMLIKR